MSKRSTHDEGKNNSVFAIFWLTNSIKSGWKPCDTIMIGTGSEACDTGHARGTHQHMEFRICDRALDIADYYIQDDTIVNLYKIKEISKKQIQPQTAEYHIVVRGDTLSAIASRYGTTVTNLCTLNHISRNSILRIGLRLRIS